jgi:glycosyltransferase involved in cell wall biosynthesis
VPLGVRRIAHPLVMRVMERRVRRALLAPEPTFRPGRVVLSGFLAEAKGVSEAARLTLAGLKSAGLDVVAHDLRPLFTGVAGLPDGPAGGVWIVHANAPEAVHVLGRIDPAAWRGRYRIAYWAYELARVPAEWVRISDAFHEIWAPSAFVADALLASGVQKPVRLMPHPVALGARAGAGDRARFGLAADAFVVLALGDLLSSAERKNLLGAIAIFLRAFPREGEARLVLKVREAGGRSAFLERARRASSGRSDITFLTGDLAPEATRSLIASCSVLLSAHRAEGFGLPLAEAFLAGVPALATGWSGNLAFMADLPELLIASTQAPVRDPYRVYRAAGQTWAEPDIEDAAAKLQALARSPGLRADLARRGATAVEALDAAWTRERLLDTPLGRLAAPVAGA